VIIIKKYLKYLILLSISLLSFYYTNIVALYVKKKNPLMQTIEDVKNTKYVNYINSTIYDNLYIIPGLNGQEINVNKSFSNMQIDNKFSEAKLVFNYIKPSISLEDNKDKIIIRGNKNKKSVSLIFEDISNLTRYLLNNNYQVDILIKEESYNLNYELINSSNIKKTYHNIDSYLTKHKANKNLCLVKNDKISSLCENKYLFKPSLVLNHSNLSTNINKIASGEIILVKNSLTLSELIILINQIKYQDLSIIPLSELIKE